MQKGYAQVQTAIIGTGTSATTSYGPAYLGSAVQKNTNHGHFIYLFTEDELLAQGITPGSVISEVAWTKGSVTLLAKGAVGIVNVSLNSGYALPDYAAAFPILSYTSSFTFGGSRSFDSDTSNFPAVTGEWVAIPVAPFVYTGGGLEVYANSVMTPMPGADSASTAGTITWRYTSTSPANKNGYYTSASAFPTASSNFNVTTSRPNIRLKFEQASNNAGVYSVAAPLADCPGNLDIKVNVRNNGKNDINSVEVHWMLDGVLQTPVTYNLPIGIAGSSGGNSAVVTLGNRTFLPGQGYQLKAWTELPNGQADAAHSDDTLTAVIGAALSGNYTIGGSSPDFPDLVSAAKDLNTFGVCGPVTFSIRPGTYSGQVLLNDIAGASATNTITFVSQNRDTASVRISYSGTSASDNYVFRLANTSYVTLKHLSIQAISTSFGTGLELTGAASYNTIDSCHVFSASTSSSSYTLALRDRVTGTGNTFTNNRIAGGYYCVYLYGTSTSVMAQDIVFDNNLVEGFTTYAANLYYTNNTKFRNNTIRTTNTTATQYGIYAGYCYGQIEFTGNRITLQRAGYGIYMQYCNATTSGKGLIANNEIVMGKLATATSTIQGLRVYNTTFQQVLNNSVNILGGSDTLAVPAYFYFSSASYQNNEIKNNIFANSFTGRCIFIYNATTSSNVYDYNLYYAAQNTKAFEAGTATKPGTFPSLTAWRAGSSVLGGQDMHSISYRPPFTAEDNLRPNASDSAVWAINGRGEQSAGNGQDITGAYRSVTLPGGVPDLGAYEVTPSSVLPPLAKATPASPAASGVQVFTIGEDTVARITWGATVPASVEVRQYSGEMPPVPVTTPADMYFHTDVSGSSGNYGYKAEIYYRNPWLGNVPAGSENLVRLARKEGASPWVSYPAGLIDINRDILTESGLPGFGQFTGSRPECAGTPVGPKITTARLPVPLCNGDTTILEARDLNTTGGITYQWQQAPALSGPWTNVVSGAGANSLQYFPGAMHDTVYYRVLAECTVSGQSAAGDTFMVPVWPAVNLLSTKDSSRCGPGTVVLEASANPGIGVSWFDGNGTFLDTGSRFVTPSIGQTTTFYAVPGTPGSGHFNTGRPAPGATFSSIGNSGTGVQFDALVPFTLESVVVYSSSTATGTLNILLHDAFGNTLATANPVVSIVAGQPTVVPLNMFVPAGYGHWLRNPSRSGISSLYYESSGVTYPYAIPGVISITGSTTSSTIPPTSAGTTYYATFYDWKISVGCQGSATPVTATVTPGPAFSITDDLTACNDAVTPLTVTSNQSSFDRYEWFPLTNLYTDAAGTIPYTGGHAAMVYVRSQIAGTYTYVATALNTTSLCGGSDTVKVHIQPAPSGMFVSSVCFSGSGVLKLNPDKGYAPGSIQWQSSADNTNWNNITGATSSIYNSPVLTNTTYYRAQVKNSQGQVCQTIADTIKVANPTIYSATPARRCGLGSVTLQASGSPGARIAWYDVPVGGTPLAIGNTFVTPVVNTTTTFYAAAEESSSLFGGLPYYDSSAVLTQAITGLSFDAYVPFTLKSVVIYVNSQAAGTITVELLDAASASLNIAVLPVPSGTLVQGRRSVVLPLNFQIPAASGLRLLATNRGGSYNTLGENGTVAFPMNTPGVFSINGGLTSATGNPTSNYYTFYDWRVSVFCEVPRLPVTATIDPAPEIDVTPATLELCLGDTARFGVSSGNSGYSYFWSPGQWTNTSIETIPTRDIIYYIHAIDSSGGPFNSCANLDSVVVIVHPLPSAVVTQKGSTHVCEGDSLSLAAATGLGYVYQWMRNDSLIDGATNSVFAASASGRYKVKVTDNSMCSVESSEIVVTAYPAPDPVIVPGHGAALSTADRYVAYQWNYDSIPIPGATQREHTPVASGDYTVTVTDANGCTGTSAVHFYSVGVTTTAVDGHRIRVYPNPAQEKVFIDTDVEVNVTLSDMAGRTLIHSEHARQIDIGAFADGVYLIRVHDQQGRLMTMKKLVKSAR